MNDDLVYQRITVARHIAPNGAQGFTVAMDENTSLIEALGLLDAARWELFAQMSERFR
jgi:hypothetical protein